MNRASDIQRILNESELAELGNVKRPRRAGWAKLGYLRAAPRGGKYGELDAIELAAFATLVASLDFEDAVLAWQDVREGIRDTAFANGSVLILFDHRSKSALVATQQSELGQHLRPGRLFELIDLTEPINEIRATYRKIRQAREARKPRKRSTAATSIPTARR